MTREHTTTAEWYASLDPETKAAVDGLEHHSTEEITAWLKQIKTDAGAAKKQKPGQKPTQ